MNLGGGLFLGYLVLKYAGYSAWCYAGLKMLGDASPAQRAKALGLGALRVALGISLGLAIWAVSTKVYASLAGDRASRQLLTYLAVYVPVRWLEWSLIASLVERSLATFFVPRTLRSVLFRLGGIAVSCVADIPMLIDGLPVGRFMC
jgi:hypothetical protein